MTQLAGLTNALMDITVRVSDADVERLGFKKGEWNRYKDIDLEGVLALTPTSRTPGGSPANTIFGGSVLGLKTAMLGTVGSDTNGIEFKASLKEYGITDLLETTDGDTGVCYVLITPDGEKSSTSRIGIAGKYGFDLSKLTDVTILHSSGYELRTNPKRTIETIEYVRTLGALVSYDLSSPEIVRLERGATEDVLRMVDILFATESEAAELRGKSPRKALSELAGEHLVVALKQGKYGSIVASDHHQYKIPAIKVKIANTNGAGDAYAAGFITSFLDGNGFDKCGFDGAMFASRVIQVEESHL